MTTLKWYHVAMIIDEMEKACEIMGSMTIVARECGVIKQAVNRWYSIGRLPKTEYLGTTQYAKAIEHATDGKVRAVDLCPLAGQYILDKFKHIPEILQYQKGLSSDKSRGVNHD